MKRYARTEGGGEEKGCDLQKKTEGDSNRRPKKKGKGAGIRGSTNKQAFNGGDVSCLKRRGGGHQKLTC